MKALSRDAKTTAGLLMAANKDLPHRERQDGEKDCETKSMRRTRWMRFCFCNSPIWNSSSQYKTSWQNIVLLPYNAVCISPQFPKCHFILLASALYLLPFPKTLALTFFKHYLLLSCWAVAFLNVSISDTNSLVLCKNPGALEFS